MRTAPMKKEVHFTPQSNIVKECLNISELVKMSWVAIAPFWPLKNLIAVNPLQGLEDLPIEEALKQGAAYFQRADLPKQMERVNRETIKWLQVFFDDGQATISMPLRKKGLFSALRTLIIYDEKLHSKKTLNIKWLQGLPEHPEKAIEECLLRLSITKEERGAFLKLMLTTLPGWAAYVKYRTEWAGLDINHPHKVTQSDFLAIRLIICSLLWPEARKILEWHTQALKQSNNSQLEKIQHIETAYRLPLLKKLAIQRSKEPCKADAQLVFCIDVRSEPFRRALEATGDYQTLGFAGFFGIPVKINDKISGESYASCPVLLSPQHEVDEAPCNQEAYEDDYKGYERVKGLKQLYQSIKYTFTTPFALVEGLGIASGAWMALRSLSPKLTFRLKTASNKVIRKLVEVTPSLEKISLEQQCAYADNALRMMGLTSHFAPLVVFCGHGSSTQNNAYATALDCGACGGRHGASNARILATILNDIKVRATLAKKGITIPKSTRFIAAEHNTTTDEVTLYGNAPETLKADLEKARESNSTFRLKHLQVANGDKQDSWLRSQDWAQVRPEWGLARNAAFIVAPRDITKEIDLEGRCFLHSYDYTQDLDGSLLTVILTAPMVVAEWINMQYLFSTLDNIAFGSGSKITKNITGKIGIMQGNASDLMTGLPLQSVFTNDSVAYHEPQRLMCVVYAPRKTIERIVQAQPVLQKLFGNGWVQLSCIEPEDHITYFLERDLTWQRTY